MGNIEFLIPKTYNFFEMSENFILYFAVLMGFALKTNFINQERSTFDKNFSYLSIGTLSIMFIVSSNMYINEVYEIRNFIILILYFFLFLSKNKKFELFKKLIFLKIDNTILSLSGITIESLPLIKPEKTEESNIFKV